MKSEFAIAVHVLSLLNHDDLPKNSEFLAGSVGVNPVVIRTVIGLLRRGGLLETQRGVAGARLTRSAAKINLLDVYRAVHAPESVLKMHQHPNPNCQVGARIQGVLDQVFSQAQAALETELAQVHLSDVTAALEPAVA
jgi:DNA-binding IscR family transcriptional regulator